MTVGCVGNLIFTTRSVFTANRERFQCHVQIYVGKAKKKKFHAVSLELMYFREP